MDLILDICDQYIFSKYIYPQSWSPASLLRQLISINIILVIGGTLLYLLAASVNYVLIFDRRLLKHPLILKDQVKNEIKYSLSSLPIMALPYSVLFILEVRGYSKLYDRIYDYKLGWYLLAGTVVWFLLFTDCLVYWIHRGLHHRSIYKYIHKDHHRFKIPTPFASHAFHPVDGFCQGVPYHIYTFLFPTHKITFLILFVFVNLWTVSIHDGDFRVPSFLSPFINGSAHHIDHHLYYNYNYGQYFTLWDRIGESYRFPSSYTDDGPINTILQSDKGNCQVASGNNKKDE